ncbi:MAG: hypothetical protein R3316_01360 [Rhodovibrionaceae bacterium]|nr:hypothetical protein [Rhodovibrionaceae bacterium]
MLTVEDCIGLCDLTEEEVRAIAEHEHIPMIVAAELGNYLYHSADGVPMLRRFILDDIEHARQHHDNARELRLRLTLRQFVQTYGGEDAIEKAEKTAEDKKAD